MHIIIKISDEEYETVKNCKKSIHKTATLELLAHLIKTGTILPKGHGDLIDRSNLLCINEYDGENERIYVPYYEIENAKPIIKADKEE